MALTPRQTSLYRHRADIWRVSRTIDPTSKRAGEETYTLVASNVPCIYKYTPNIDSEIPGAGRLKEFTMLVLDVVTFEANTPLQDADILVNVTILSDGSKSNAWGQAHHVEGAPTIQDSVGNRRVNNLFVMAMSMEHAPPAIVGNYAV